MSESHQNRPEMIGQANGRYSDKEGKLTRLEMRFHEAESSQNGLKFRVMAKQNDLDNNETVTWGTAFANVVGQQSDKVVFNVSTVARQPGPRTDDQNNFLDANGAVVESAEQAQEVMKPMINPKTNRPVYIPLATIFTADKSKNDKPYPQTMFTGKVYTQAEGLDIARQDFGAASARQAGHTEKANQYASKSDELKKSTGAYFSLFPDASLLNQVNSLFKINVNMPKPKVQNDQNHSAPAGP